MQPPAATPRRDAEPLVSGEETVRPKLSLLERTVLVTLLYSDLFEYPLTEDELYRYLTAPCADRERLHRALESLIEKRFVIRNGEFFCRRGRESTVELRRQRHLLAKDRWPAALRFGRWLTRVPFLRMVAVCGSQAVENGDRNADIDLFLITAPERLWLVQATTMVLKRLGRRLGFELCPNYLLTTDALEIEDRNLYTAREIAQTVPLWGECAYDRFLAANTWITGFLPQLDLDDRKRRLEPATRPRLTAAVERLLSGRLGHLLDRAVHRLLLIYYQLRLRRHGWRRTDVERAYRPERQVVIRGGFGGAVAERFLDRSDDLFSREELEGWFFGAADTYHTGAAAPDPLYAGIMARRYGAGSR